MKTARVAYSGAIHKAFPDKSGLRLDDGRIVSETDVVWLAPFDVQTIIALGLNYADHVKELSKELTITEKDEPLVFLKGSNSVIGHRGHTRRPRGVAFLAWSKTKQEAFESCSLKPPGRLLEPPSNRGSR
jgi:5-oxopent-3-ene-1,2,5-tricarboxylate decarboxylase/2-hydroxyhepta-2,4-diene-1,7-dioate isomerase